MTKPSGAKLAALMARFNSDLETNLETNLETSEDALQKCFPSQDSNHFRLLVEAVEDYAIYLLDPEGRVLTWNLGAQRLKGYPAEEILGTHFRRFYTPEDQGRKHPENELKLARQNGKYEEEGWRVRKDGTRFWAQVVITALKNSEGQVWGFGKVTRDLTERKKAEDALRQANEELEARVKLRTEELQREKSIAENAVKERDIFFSIASHELKTPLSALRLQAQLRKRSVLKGDFSDFAPENLLDLCTDDERQVDRLIFLVDNMLNISRLTSGNFHLHVEEFILEEMVQKAVQRMEPILRETGNLCSVSLGAELTRGQWDAHRLEQVLTNLLSNAGKYAPGTPVEVSVQAEGTHVTIRVRDQGPGIPAAAQTRIFEPFERLKSAEKASGMGLGLYIAKQIVEAHQGSLRLESAAGEGTTFIIQLPKLTPLM